MRSCEHRVTVLVTRQLALEIEAISGSRAYTTIEGNCERCGTDIQIEFIRHIGEGGKGAKGKEHPHGILHDQKS